MRRTASVLALLMAIGLFGFGFNVYLVDGGERRDWANREMDALNREMKRNNDELQLQIDQKERDIAQYDGKSAVAKKASNAIYADRAILEVDANLSALNDSSSACSAHIGAIEQRAWIPIALAIAGAAFLIAALVIYPRKREVSVAMKSAAVL